MTHTRLLGLAIAGVIAGTAPAFAQADLVTVTFTTTPAGGPYAPRNVVAVWIEDSAGGFVKTIGRWANVRKQHLVAWAAASGQDADAVSGATRTVHTGALVATWDLADRAGVLVPDGTYTVRMEVADANSTTTTQNNEGTFTFVKNGQSSTQTSSGGGFTDVTIDYSAASASCDDGVIDPGETCDPPGSCPTSCAAPADACMLNTLVGTAAGCTAECIAEPITACVDDDGCCVEGCDDSDCGAAPVAGGCSSSNPSLVLLLLVVPLIRRRRPRFSA